MAKFLFLSCSPSLEEYPQSLDLYDMVYNGTSRLEFKLVAVDNGYPHRGVTANVSLPSWGKKLSSN